MASCDASQGRALAIILSLVTLIAHGATYLVLEAIFAGSWGTSWYGLYDVAAVAASTVGLVGAIQRRPFLISAYTLVHSITLTMITLLLFINVLPPGAARIIPIFPSSRYDVMEKSMCGELDDGFGWDEHWYEQCRSSFRALSAGIVWSGLIMMAAQWWAIVSVCNWAIALKREETQRKTRHMDIERGGQEGKWRLR